MGDDNDDRVASATFRSTFHTHTRTPPDVILPIVLRINQVNLASSYSTTQLLV